MCRNNETVIYRHSMKEKLYGCYTTHVYTYYV